MLFKSILPLLIVGAVSWPTMPVIPTFPPCFPFCNSVTPMPRPTTIPLPTPTIRITPTVIPTVVTPTVTPTPNVTESPTPSPTGVPATKIQLGAFVGSQPYNSNDIQNFENRSGKHLSVVLWYQSMGVTDGTQNFMKSWMDLVDGRGSTPYVTLEPWNYTAGVNQPQYKLSNITAGNFDAYFRKFAQDSKAWGKPFYFRFAHEMNGNWYPWAESVNGNKSGDYAKAWKHVVDIFRAEGATNAKFVWCPNVNYQGSTPLSGLFPGDNYVDYVCMDGYNWGDTNGGFQSFTNLFSSTYNNITTISSKDVIIGEMASAEQGGSKSNWITDAYTKAIDAFPKIKLITWFNQNKEKDWRIESSTTSQNAFKAAVNGGRY